MTILPYIDRLLDLTREAGLAILRVYESPLSEWNLESKGDSSPLTLADRLSHDVIEKGLTKLTPHIPIMSEEGSAIPVNVRKHWDSYWCVDPLDGTKEFISKNGEFTVNIALIVHNKPVFGIIYVPVKDILYYGGKDIGSFKIAGMEKIRIFTDQQPAEFIAVGSKSHAVKEESDFLNALHVKSIVQVGSSLKFCMVAEGKAHIYYRHGPTMEWDTAAGHAIALASGASMSGINGDAFIYNKPNLLNPGFI